jgi:hypothetical protein
MYTNFLRILSKNRFLEIEKGRFLPKASALRPLQPAMANGPKGLLGLAAAARSGCHTAQAGLAARARRERVDCDHRVRCADRGAVADGGWAR